MRCLIVGYGSIGARHARLLHALGHDVAVVTKRVDTAFSAYASIAEAGAASGYDLVVVSSPTGRHADDYAAIVRHVNAKTILLEKPVFATQAQAPDMTAPCIARSRVAYNLRFHPSMARVRQLLEGKTLYSAMFYVGQYLPDWRPGRDYRKVYSADKNQGGGVLRELSHELDLACHLTGTWKELTALGGHLSHLKISADDTFSITSVHERCPHVGIHVNYLDRIKRRYFVIQYSDGTMVFDFVTNTLVHNSGTETFACPPDLTYERQLKAVLGGTMDDCCTVAEGLDVLHMIEAAENAAQRKIWIKK